MTRAQEARPDRRRLSHTRCTLYTLTLRFTRVANATEQCYLPRGSVAAAHAVDKRSAPLLADFVERVWPAYSSTV